LGVFKPIMGPSFSVEKQTYHFQLILFVGQGLSTPCALTFFRLPPLSAGLLLPNLSGQKPASSTRPGPQTYISRQYNKALLSDIYPKITAKAIEAPTLQQFPFIAPNNGLTKCKRVAH